MGTAALPVQAPGCCATPPWPHASRRLGTDCETSGAGAGGTAAREATEDEDVDSETLGVESSCEWGAGDEIDGR